MIVSADTVVVSVPSSSTGDSLPADATILEKPLDANDNLQMLLNLAMPARPRASVKGPIELADSTTPRCEVVTGVSVVYPTLQYPGYKVETMAEATRIWFGDLSLGHLQA